MSLLTLCVPLDSSFVSTQFFVLNLDGCFHSLPNKFIIFDIPLIYYHTSLNSSIICCLFSGDIYFSLFESSSLLTDYKLFCEVFQTFVILSAFLLPIKSPFASAVFWIVHFETVSAASVPDL